MEHMMMEPAGPEILGFSFGAFLMLLSGVFYVICAILVWRKYITERNELVGALLAFLIYQSFNMIFMGIEIHTMNMIYSSLAALSVFVGSTYMLKFPLSPLSKSTRNSIFFLSLIVVLGLFAWFMFSEERQMELMNFTLWYDLVVNGIIVGGFMLLLAFKTSERVLKIKAYGGGTGVISCCVVSSAAMISGSVLTGALFGFLAPILILSTLFFSDKNKI
jgi:hypothetical protein